jgi:hypothetical protein
MKTAKRKKNKKLRTMLLPKMTIPITSSIRTKRKLFLIAIPLKTSKVLNAKLQLLPLRAKRKPRSAVKKAITRIQTMSLKMIMARTAIAVRP